MCLGLRVCHMLYIALCGCLVYWENLQDGAHRATYAAYMYLVPKACFITPTCLCDCNFQGSMEETYAAIK